MNIVGLRRSEYGISVFALEDGLPVPGVVTSPKIVRVDTNSDQGLHVILLGKLVHLMRQLF